MSHRGSARRRESFDEVAELYERARPRYPKQLVDDLLALSGVREGQRVLEIGPGTGQLTVPLAERGLSIAALELGANLARVARRNLARFERVEVIVADFDQWPLPGERFDLVVAATAFHWLDAATRMSKCAAALRPGGALAIVETHWGVGGEDDAFFRASQSCHARWDPDHDPDFRAPRPDELPERCEDLENSPRFEALGHRRYLCERAHNAAQYCDLLATFSNIRALGEQSRRGFLACIARLIESRFADRIVRQDVHDLWLARARTGLDTG